MKDRKVGLTGMFVDLAIDDQMRIVRAVSKVVVKELPGINIGPEETALILLDLLISSVVVDMGEERGMRACDNGDSLSKEFNSIVSRELRENKIEPISILFAASNIIAKTNRAANRSMKICQESTEKVIREVLDGGEC